MIPSFKEYYTSFKTIESCIEKSETLEQLFENLSECGVDVGAVMTSNISAFTAPLNSIVKRSIPMVVSEKAPDDPEIEKWIRSSKSAFKQKYGKNWETVLYATAWKMYNNKNK